MTGASTPQKTKTGRIFAIIGVLLLLGSIGPMPDFVEEVEAVDGSDSAHLSVTLSDYQTEVAELLGEGAFAYVVLEDSEFSRPDIRGNATVVVTSESDADGIELNLLETGIGTGVFKGGFGFAESSLHQTPHPVFGQIGDADIKVALMPGNMDGETVRIELKKDSGTSTEFEWLPATDAELEIWLDGGTSPLCTIGRVGTACPITATAAPLPIAGTGQDLIFRIFDDDLNREPGEPQSYSNLLRAFSDSDPTGESITITKTSEPNGNMARFDGTLRLTSSASGSGLHIKQGDRIFFQFAEPNTNEGEPELTTIFAERSSGVGGAIIVEPKIYFGPTSDKNKHGLDRALLVVADPGIKVNGDVLATNTARSESIDIFLNQDCTEPSSILATQAGARSSLYVATLTFGDDGDVVTPGSVDVSYESSDGCEKDDFTWIEMGSAIIDIGPNSDPEGFMVGTSNQAITVNDPDSAGGGAIDVRVVTTSSEPGGLTVELTENGPGVFTGSVGLTTGSTGNGKIQVADGDAVVVEYDDPFTNDGSNQLVRSSAYRWIPSLPDDLDDVAVDASTIDVTSIGFFDAALAAEIQDATSNLVNLRLETEDDVEDGVIKVELRSEICEGVPAFLEETESGSGVFSGRILIEPDDDGVCTRANIVPVKDGLGVLVDLAEPGHGIFDVIEARDGVESLATLLWHPSHNAQLSVVEPAFGGGPFSVELHDGDGFPHRVSEVFTTDSAETIYNLAESFVPGTELVYIEREESDSYGTGSTTRTYDVEAGGAAVPIVDRDGDGIVTCSDIEISGQRDVEPLVGGGSSGPTPVSCTAVVGDEISFQFTNCPAGGTGESVDCIATFVYSYLPLHNEDCATASNVYAYNVTENGIELCGTPQGDRDLVLSAVDGTRTVTGIGPAQESSDATLSFDRMENGIPVFTGDVPIWFSQASSPRDVAIAYEEPTQGFDGRAGSDDPTDFRSAIARTQWRPAETGSIHFRNTEFTGGASEPVFGPGVAIEVRDSDAGHPDRQDTITILAGITSNKNNQDEFDLVETGQSTGVFRGVIPIGSDGVNVGDNSDLHVTYVDKRGGGGGVTDITDSIRVRTADTGSPSVEVRDIDTFTSGDSISSRDRFFIQLEDRDSTPESEVTVRITSESDPRGELITLTREGSGVDATFRSGELRVETTHNPGNGRIFVGQDVDSETITIEYNDPLNEEGQVERTSFEFVWDRAVDPVVRLDKDFHIGAITDTTERKLDEVVGLDRIALMTITIEDLSKVVDPKTVNDFMAPSADFCIQVSNDPSEECSPGRTLDFVETAPGTGNFIGFMAINGNNGGAGDFELLGVPNHGEKIRVHYGDVWVESSYTGSGFGKVTFDRGGYTINGDPVITLYDSDLGHAETPTIQVFSTTDLEGISLKLDLREDLKEFNDNNEGAEITGVFTGTLNLRTSSSSGNNLEVNANSDEITARYQDLDPPGTRTTTAAVGVGEEPVTTLVTTPAQPDGDNGWFVSEPTVTFDVNRLVEDTFYRINGGALQTFTNDITLGEGIHEFEFWSVDLIEGITENVKTETIMASLSNPADAVIEGLNATARPGGNIALNWDAVSGKTDPLLFGAYKIFRGPEGADFTDADEVGDITSESFTDTPPSDDPPQQGETFTYFVRVANEAGRLGPVSDAIDGLSDRVAPSLESFEVDADELREEDDEDTISATLTVTDDPDNLEDLEEVFMRVIDPFGEQLEEVDMESVDSTTWSLDYDGFEECGVYTLLGIASDAVGNEGRLNHSVRYVAIDVEAPRVVDLTQEVEQGQDVNVTVRDNCAGIESVSYSIDGGDSRDVTIPARGSREPCEPGPCEVSFQIPADRLAEGENRITFVLADANETANEAVVTMTVLVKIPEETAAAPDVTTPPSIGEGSSLVEFGGRFSFTMSGGTPTSLTFEVDGLVDERSILNGLNAATGLVRVDVAELEAGPHEAIVRAGNPSGNDRQTFSFYVLESGIPLPPGNVWVEKDENGRPVVNWDASPSDASKVGGYIVHRAASPWVVIGVTDANTFSYTDLTALGSKNYQYAVTAFGPNGEGSLEPGADSEESLPWFQGVQATSFQTDEIDEGIPTYIWWGLLVVLAVLVVVSLVYVNRQAIFGRKPEHLYAQDTVQEEYPDEAAESSTPFGEERHMIRCPNCSDEFHVSGERPIVTDCPNCGRKGILR